MKSWVPADPKSTVVKVEKLESKLQSIRKLLSWLSVIRQANVLASGAQQACSVGGLHAKTGALARNAMRIADADATARPRRTALGWSWVR